MKGSLLIQINVSEPMRILVQRSLRNLLYILLDFGRSKAVKE